MQPKNLSPSSLNSFMSCPKKWKSEQLGKLGIAVPETPRLFGTAIHNCIVIYFDKISDKPSGDEIEAVAKEAFDEGTTRAMKSSKAKTKRVLENFISFEKSRARSWRVYKPEFVEKKVEAELFDDLPPFRSIVDFYGNKTVLDWKTGRGGLHESSIRQGKIYKSALQRLGYEVEKVLFVFLDVGASLQIPKTTDGWIYKTARRMVNMVEADRFPKNPSGLCGWCPYVIDCEFEDVCLWEAI